MGHMSNHLSEAARPAAEWWGEQVRAVRAETDGLHPALSSSQAFVATAGIALREQQIDSTAASDTVVEAFVERLTDLIEQCPDDVLRLSVDYHPCQILSEAADAAGLPNARFPGKTTLRIRADHVVGKAGYAAPWRLVWSAPGWEHPVCDVQDWPEGSDDPVSPACGQPLWHAGKHDWQ